MIALLLALVSGPQALPVMPPPSAADIPAIVSEGVAHCRRSQDDWITAPHLPDAGDSNGAHFTRNGERVTVETRRTSCTITTSSWRPEGERMALTVQQASRVWKPGFQIQTWRRPLAGEASGVSTVLEQRGADGHVLSVIRITEPADGVTGELTVRWELTPG